MGGGVELSLTDNRSHIEYRIDLNFKIYTFTDLNYISSAGYFSSNSNSLTFFTSVAAKRRQIILVSRFTFLSFFFFFFLKHSSPRFVHFIRTNIVFNMAALQLLPLDAQAFIFLFNKLYNCTSVTATGINEVIWKISRAINFISRNFNLVTITQIFVNFSYNIFYKNIHSLLNSYLKISF